LATVMLVKAYRLLVWPLLLALGFAALACSGGSGAGVGGSGAGEPTAVPHKGDVIIATTTSTQDSGLLDVLLPVFEKRTGWTPKPIAVGSGQAIQMGRDGNADVLLVHSPAAELQFMDQGYGKDRLLVMHNDFIIVGPASDPAGVKGAKTAIDAMKAIASKGATFISRGDASGTNALELDLWKQANIDPKGKGWYQESGQGMGATLQIADQKDAYTVSDRGTYLALKPNLKLQILNEGDKAYFNVYHVITLNPEKDPKINAAGGQAFADFMVSKEAQDIIASFGKDKYGQPLFVADAGKSESAVH
jgi:tungstate transport system substrate-binding protein